MVDLINLHDQVDKDFAIARRRARMRGLCARLSKRFGSGTLVPFEETRRALGAVGGIRVGREAVEISRVVGSVGQHERFDAAFMPLRGAYPERWKRVDMAFLTGLDLQPVSLLALDGTYFVEDGHNRISVARFHGAEWIDAEVMRFRSPRSVRELHIVQSPHRRLYSPSLYYLIARFSSKYLGVRYLHHEPTGRGRATLGGGHLRGTLQRRDKGDPR